MNLSQLLCQLLQHRAFVKLLIELFDLNDTRQTLLALIMPEAARLKAKNMSPWTALEKWWIGAPDFSYPISTTEGSAVFRAGYVKRAVPFAARYPK